MMWLRAFCGVTLAVAGCNAIADFPESFRDPDENEGSGGAGAGPVGEACGMSSACVIEPPLGWSGPVVLSEHDAAGGVPECAAPFSTAVVSDAMANLMWDPAMCGCVCTPPAGEECGMAEVRLSGDASCANPGNAMPLGASPCIGALSPPPSNIAGAMTEAAPTENGTCGAPSVEAIIDEPTGSHRAVCAVDAPERQACPEGRLCVPQAPMAFESSVCVYAEGERDCPTTFGFDERTVLYDGVDDSRACGPCSCTYAPGECSGTTTLYSQNGCANPKLAFPHDGDCHALPSPGFLSLAIEIELHTGTCEPSVNEPTGTVSPRNAITVCCTPML